MPRCSFCLFACFCCYCSVFFEFSESVIGYLSFIQGNSQPLLFQMFFSLPFPLFFLFLVFKLCTRYTRYSYPTILIYLELFFPVFALFASQSLRIILIHVLAQRVFSQWYQSTNKRVKSVHHFCYSVLIFNIFFTCSFLGFPSLRLQPPPVLEFCLLISSLSILIAVVLNSQSDYSIIAPCLVLMLALSLPSVLFGMSCNVFLIAGPDNCSMQILKLTQ